MNEYGGQKGTLQGDYVPRILSSGKWVTDPLRVPASPMKPCPWLKILQDIEQELMRTSSGEVKNAAN